jgi:tRNA-modifying protein YgfZ
MNTPLADTPWPWNWRPEAPSRIEQPVGLLRLQGPDALRVLHGQTTQAIAGSAPGSCLATCLTSPTARLRALAQVLVEPGGAWLVIESGDAGAVRQALDQVLFPADQVELGPLQQGLLVTPVPGQGEVEPLDALPQADPGRWMAREDGGGWQLGPQLLLLDSPLPHWLAERSLLAPLDAERWRIQQGWPAAPGEINDNTNPLELGLHERISLSKGCYVGQETLAKLSTYDGVKQQLRRWSLVQDQPLQSGQLLRDAAGERAGTITSALAVPQSEGLTLWIGLALVRRHALAQPRLWAGEGPDAPALELAAAATPQP